MQLSREEPLNRTENEEMPEPILPTYEQVRPSRRGSILDGLPLSRTAIPICCCKRLALRHLFIFILVASSGFLLSGVILGVMSMRFESFRMIGMVLILIGVLGIVSSAPCCFFYFIKMRRLPSFRRQPSNLSNDSAVPAIISNLYPATAMILDNPAFQNDIDPASSQIRVNRRNRLGRPVRRDVPLPPYEPPPPYSEA